MPFTLLPAVDVADGRAVRLAQGVAASATRHGDPLDLALAWQTGGAEWIHLVDLDAAFGRGSNAELLAGVIDRLAVKVQLSGGICDRDSLEHALSTGCERAVLGTAALRDPAWCEQAVAEHGARIAVALDVRVFDDPTDGKQHRLGARGSDHDDGDLWDTVAWLDSVGCARYVVTDVGKDGMLSGTDADLYRRVAQATAGSVIASGGVSSIDDLVVLADVASAEPNFEGSIVGTALSAGRFTLPEAIAAVASAAS